MPLPLTDSRIAHLAITHSASVEKLSSEIEQLRADLARMTEERDARPNITPEDAANWVCGCCDPNCIAAGHRVDTALYAHAAKARKVESNGE